MSAAGKTLSPQQSAELKARALALGFDLAGFANLPLPQADQERLERFVLEGRHGTMDWFAKHLSMRRDPRLVLASARSALVLAACYRHTEQDRLLANAAIKISRYAMGRDYHRIIRKRCKKWVSAAVELVPALQTRIAVDSAPIPEKSLARLAGIAWQGKHTNMIHPRLGSFFFLAVVLLDHGAPSENPMPDRCGSCRLCVDACPTNALQPYELDARKCISYLTIETKQAVQESLGKRFENWAFGCDICQEVCPYNVPLPGMPERTSGWAEFAPREEAQSLMESGELSEQNWERLSTGSALRRAGLSRLQESIGRARRGQNP